MIEGNRILYDPKQEKSAFVGNLKRAETERDQARESAEPITIDNNLNNIEGDVDEIERRITQISMKYRKKPVVIEAEQLRWNNWSEICEFVPKESFGGGVYLDDKTLEELPPDKTSNTMGLKIKTLEGTMLAKQGDYIIKGVKGEFYPCKPDIFAETYEKV